MFEKLKEFTGTRAGRVVSGTCAALALACAGYAAYSSIGSGPAELSANRVFIDADTLQSFHCELRAGMTLPVKSPYSGKNTGYPAEMCYWTRDGKVSDKPTPVLLNSYKGIHDPTFCPECGRLVIAHNPHPMPESKPPPTAQDYRNRFAQQEDQ